MKHDPDFSLIEVKILKLGRHFRLNPRAKLLVGRNEKENLRLKELAGGGDLYFTPLEINGPAALGKGVFTQPEK